MAWLERPKDRISRKAVETGVVMGEDHRGRALASKRPNQPKGG